MTDRPFNINLEMATVPAAPLGSVRIAGPHPWFNSYFFLRFIQKLAVFVFIGCLSVGSYCLAANYVVKSVKVVGQSMVPTLKENNRYLLNIWALRNRDPNPGDIVVIRDPGDHGLSVKRIIAVGGQSIHFKDGKVFVDGRELDEPYLMPNVRTFTYSRIHEKFITCGKDQFFVLGDNRPVSIDSRSYGPVSRQNILGLVEPR